MSKTNKNSVLFYFLIFTGLYIARGYFLNGLWGVYQICTIQRTNEDLTGRVWKINLSQNEDEAASTQEPAASFYGTSINGALMIQTRKEKVLPIPDRNPCYRHRIRLRVILLLDPRKHHRNEERQKDSSHTTRPLKCIRRQPNRLQAGQAAIQEFTFTAPASQVCIL